MPTIGRIVDNDSQGTKVQLSDGSFSIVAHGGPAPSIGQEVEVKEFGYCVPVEGTRPHQTVDLMAHHAEDVKAVAEWLQDDAVDAIARYTNNALEAATFESGNTANTIIVSEELPNAVDASGSNAENQGGDNSDQKTHVGGRGKQRAKPNRK